MADADRYERHYLLGRQRLETRVETPSFYRSLLLMIILVHQLTSRIGAVYNLNTVRHLKRTLGPCDDPLLGDVSVDCS
jgi:hypothetical protein